MTAGTPDGPGRPDDDFGFEVPDDLSGLDGLDAAPTESAAPAGKGGDDAPSVDVPDDLSGLEAAAAEPDEPVVAIVVTQVAGAKPLAAACSLAGVDVDAVPSPVGALAVLRDATDATRTAEAAAAISRMLRTSPVILMDRRAGRIQASRWTAGEKEDDLAAGLVLSGAPEVLDDLLVGGAAVGEVDGVETSVGMSRWAAMRALSAGGRRRRD
ncbi:hypothetical protein [Cellulomonas pakistanensis]|uniref:Uncharacterized protein n=1 Tax=Cellulomonas pakistanensis TaxID=992287 RepID=A0A919PFM9_9CELL|nr:hypothetical protein [Cellulomonas pakistanensis]GIG37984.1 hypothetical protein Cpa01nite_33650 [Cellulomonas pakistanensis]